MDFFEVCKGLQNLKPMSKTKLYREFGIGENLQAYKIHIRLYIAKAKWMSKINEKSIYKGRSWIGILMWKFNSWKNFKFPK